jgi:HEAT repeat protein
LQGALELSRPTDPAALGVLGRIALSPEPGLQRSARSAARALAAIHSAPTLPILGKMLDNRDPEIRTAAVNGLSSFVTNLPVRRPVDMASMAWMTPNGPGQYLTEDVKQHVELGPISKYRQDGIVDFWRAWWADKGASLTPAK